MSICNTWLFFPPKHYVIQCRVPIFFPPELGQNLLGASCLDTEKIQVNIKKIQEDEGICFHCLFISMCLFASFRGYIKL